MSSASSTTMDAHIKRKVTAKVAYVTVRRPASPTKSLAAVAPASAFPRPKAKVNSSATIGGARKPPYSTSAVSGGPNSRATASPAPRAPSPFKPPDVRNGRASPVPKTPRAHVKIRSDLKPKTPASVPSTPNQTHVLPAFLSTTASDPILATPRRVRHVSLSSISRLSSSSSLNNISSSPSSPVSLPPICPDADPASSSSALQPIRIKSKVSPLLKSKAPAFSPPTHTPPPEPPSSHPPFRNNTNAHIIRTPSISSLSASKQQFYPITTASPAANAHRFGTTRAPPSGRPHAFQPFSTTHVEPGAARVDPAFIPLPPQSPPTSSLSFSSRSSASPSSGSSASRSTAPTLNSHLNGSNDASYVRGHVEAVVEAGAVVENESRSRAGSSAAHDSGGRVYGYEMHGLHTNGAEADEERKVRAEAKTNRKIADLEITNRSLLAINATLEASKHQQAKEIRDLRRRLRESRLVLPPRAYRIVKSSLPEEEEEEEDDEEGTENDLELLQGKDDEIFGRVKGMLETLLESGRRALEMEADDFLVAKGGAKVLHEEEARPWRDRGRGADEDYDQAESTHEESYGRDQETDSGLGASQSPSQVRVVVPGEAFDTASEDEVEALVGDDCNTAKSNFHDTPPITISHLT